MISRYDLSSCPFYKIHKQFTYIRTSFCLWNIQITNQKSLTSHNPTASQQSYRWNPSGCSCSSPRYTVPGSHTGHGLSATVFRWWSLLLPELCCNPVFQKNGHSGSGHHGWRWRKAGSAGLVSLRHWSHRSHWLRHGKLRGRTERRDQKVHL